MAILSPRFKRVRRGEAIRADIFNKLVDSMNDLLVRVDKIQRADTSYLATFAQAQNNGVTSLDKFEGAVVIGQKVTVNNPQNQRETLLSIRTPEAGDDSGKLVVAQDYIAPGATGRVLILGVGWAKTGGGTGNYGTLAVGAVALTLGASGTAQVMGVSGPYALVRIGGGGSGGGGGTFWTYLTMNGGDN